jgi:hypothetical protein
VVVAAVVALATSGVALLFTLVPTLKPDPREDIGGEVAVFAVEPGVSFNDWLGRVFPDPRDRRRIIAKAIGPKPEPSELKIKGEVIYVKSTVTGFKHRNVTLHPTVYSAATQEEVNLRGPDVPPVRVDAPTERSVSVLWIPSLVSGSKTRVFVRVALHDDAGAILAVDDSKVLTEGRAELEQ